MQDEYTTIRGTPGILENASISRNRRTGERSSPDQGMEMVVRREAWLDDALDNTFPASVPVASPPESLTKHCSRPRPRAGSGHAEQIAEGERV
jgi:hypothetical protein